MLLEEIFQWDFMQFDLSSVWTEQLTLYASFHHPMKLWVYNSVNFIADVEQIGEVEEMPENQVDWVPEDDVPLIDQVRAS